MNMLDISLWSASILPTFTVYQKLVAQMNACVPPAHIEQVLISRLISSNILGSRLNWIPWKGGRASIYDGKIWDKASRLMQLFDKLLNRQYFSWFFSINLKCTLINNQLTSIKFFKHPLGLHENKIIDFFNTMTGFCKKRGILCTENKSSSRPRSPSLVMFSSYWDNHWLVRSTILSSGFL